MPSRRGRRSPGLVRSAGRTKRAMHPGESPPPRFLRSLVAAAKEAHARSVGRSPGPDGRAVIERVAVVILGLALGCLTLGVLLAALGSDAWANRAWLAAGLIGASYATWGMVDSLRRGRVGVDAIAVLAEVGAILVGELFAAAVIGVMVASGRALETWASGRARHDLRALLQRAPVVAHRYDGSALQTVPVADVEPGARLFVKPGEVVPVDGVLLTAAVLDESALTGEALPVEREVGSPVRSGGVNAGSPFDLRSTTSAAESTYAGIVRLVSEAETSQAPFVRLADRYAVWFLVLTLVVAGAAWVAAGPTRAVAVLVVATPCPLILAPPIAFVSGLSRGTPRSGGEERWSARTAGAMHHAPPRQDGNAHERPCGARRDRPGGHHARRRGPVAGRLAGPDVSACPCYGGRPGCSRRGAAHSSFPTMSKRSQARASAVGSATIG